MRDYGVCNDNLLMFQYTHHISVDDRVWSSEKKALQLKKKVSSSDDNNNENKIVKISLKQSTVMNECERIEY